MTQEELSAAAGCDAKTLRRAERGQRVDLSTLQKLASALQVTVSAILRLDQNSLNREQLNMQRVRDWHAAFAHCDVEGVLKLFNRDGVVKHPGPTHVPGTGTYRGKSQLHEYFAMCFDTFEWEKGYFQSGRLHAVDNLVWFRSRSSTMVRATGERFTTEMFQEFLFSRGKIVNLVGLMDMSGIGASFGSGRRPGKGRVSSR